MNIHSYHVTVKDKTDWGRTINASSPGKAKVEYYHHLLDCWLDIPFTALRVRKVGGPVTSAQFVRNAIYRGLPDLKCGAKVKVGQSIGIVVDHNSSANFVVEFEPGDVKYPGLRLSVHPGELEII